MYDMVMGGKVRGEGRVSDKQTTVGEGSSRKKYSQLLHYVRGAAGDRFVLGCKPIALKALDLMSVAFGPSRQGEDGMTISQRRGCGSDDDV